MARDENDTTQVIQVDERLFERAETKQKQGTLTMLTGPRPGVVFTLEQATCVIGRAETAEIQVTDSGLSRRHAQVFREAGTFYVEDLDSTNGTYLNGMLLEAPHALRDGDRIQVGQETVLRFAIQDALEQEAAKRVYEASVRDPLTRLHNRRYLDERLSGEFAYAARHGTRLAVLLLDVDHFKQLNDTKGHPAGDAVLRHLAAGLQSMVRAEDLVARYGGEEFLIVARGIDADGAKLFAERIRRAIASLSIPWEEGSIQITASIGVAWMGSDRAFDTPTALVAAADGALYKAKRAGRNRIEHG